MDYIQKEVTTIIKTFCQLYEWTYGTPYQTTEQDLKHIQQRLLSKYTIKEILKRLYRSFVNDYSQGVPASINDFINQFQTFTAETAILDLPPMTEKFQKAIDEYHELCSLVNMAPEGITKEIALQLYPLTLYNSAEFIDKLLTIGVLYYRYTLSYITKTINSINITLSEDVQNKIVDIAERKFGTGDNSRSAGLKYLETKVKLWSGQGTI